MPDNCEQLKWQPILSDCDLLMYLRAARSVSTFAGMCDGGSVGDGCVSASRDETTINALELLHEHEYNTSKALQALVLKPLPKGTDKKWTDDEQKRFIKGLRQYGKDFFKIKQELLSHKETSELVEYYYLWKKTPSAANARPRRHRRPFSIRRNTANNSYPQNSNNGSKNSNPIASAQLVEFSSSSDEEGEESEEDSDSTVGQDKTTICQHCLTTTAKDFQAVGKDNGLLCTECRLYYKKNGEYRPLDNLTTANNLTANLTTATDANGSKVQTRRSKDSKDNGSFKLKKDNSLEPNSPINVDVSLSESNEQKLTSDLNSSIKSNKLVNDSPKKGKKHKIVNDDKLNNKKVKTEDDESTDQLNNVKEAGVDDAQQAAKEDDIEVDKLIDADKLTELNETNSLIDKKDEDSSKESGSLNDNQDKLNSNNQESINKESSSISNDNLEIVPKKESNQLNSGGSPATNESIEQTVNNLDKADESNSQPNKINDELTNNNSSVQAKDNSNQLILSDESNKSITNQDSQLSTATSIKKEVVDDNGANKSEFNNNNDNNQQPSAVNDESKLVPKIESNSSFSSAINSDSNSSITQQQQQQSQMNPQLQQTTATITTSATVTPINNLPPSLTDPLNQFSPFNLPGLDKNLLNQLPPGHHPFLQHLNDPANSSAAAAAAASGLPPGFPPGLPYSQLPYLNPSLFGRGLPPGFPSIPPNFPPTSLHQPPTSLASEQQRQQQQQSANNSSSLNNSASNSNLPNNNQLQSSASIKQHPRSSPVTNLNRNHLQPTPEQQQQAVNAALQSQLQHPFGLNPLFPQLTPQQAQQMAAQHHHFLQQSFVAQQAKRFMQQQQQQQQQQQNANQSLDFDQDSDEMPIYRGPSPKVKIDDKELLRCKSGIFIRHLYRGEFSSCSRTDLTYKPAPDSAFVANKAEKQRKRMEKEREEQKKIAHEKQQQLQQQQHMEQQKQQMEHMAQLHMERQHRMNQEYAAAVSAANRPNAPPFSPGFRNAGLTPNPPNLNANNQSNPNSGNQSLNLSGSQSQQPGSNNNNSLPGLPGFPPGYPFPGLPGQVMDPLLLQLEFQKFAKEQEEREKKERLEIMEKRENEMRKFAALAGLPNASLNPYDQQLQLELQRRYASLGFPQQAPNQLPNSTQSLPNSLQQHQHQNTTVSLPGSMSSSSAIYSAAERERFGLHGLNALSSHSNANHPNNANSTSAAETLHSLSTDRLQSERLAALGNINNEHLARLQMINAAAASSASNLMPPTSTPNDLHNAAQHNHPLHSFNPGSLPGLQQSNQSQNAPGMQQSAHQSLVGQNQAQSLESQLHHNLAGHPGLLPAGMMNPALVRGPNPLNPSLFPRPELNLPNAAGLLRPGGYDELTQQLMLKHHQMYSR